MKAISRRIAALEAALPAPPEEVRIAGMTLYEIADRLFEQEREELFTAIHALTSDDAGKKAEKVILEIVSLARKRLLAGLIVVRGHREAGAYWAEIRERKRSGLTDWQNALRFKESLVRTTDRNY